LNFFALYFGGIWLCIPLETTFEQKTYAAPLGTTFCSFVMLCIPLGTTLELLPSFFSFSALDGTCSDVTFYILLGDFALIELNKKRKITSYGPIKNISPLWKGKGCHRKKGKRLHQITHNIVEAHQHSKI
jgi:hypothetical protein